MKYATLGTVSHGTLRNGDLMASFSDYLEYLVQSNKSFLNKKDMAHYSALIDEAKNTPDDFASCEDVVQDLFDALEVFAPPYCYFGAIEGDGSDFGYWPSIDAIEELPKVNDPSEVTEDMDDCVFVNDHGNVTVYSQGKVILELV